MMLDLDFARSLCSRRVAVMTESDATHYAIGTRWMKLTKLMKHSTTADSENMIA